MGHHYVPQKYLQGFTQPTNPKALWQFDKGTQQFTETPVSIKRIAQQRQFYADETETALNELVEIPGNAVLTKLRNGDFDLTDTDRANLSVYIATMTHRVPNHRLKADEMAPGVLDNVTSRLRDQIRAFADAGRISSDVAARRLAETDEAHRKFSKTMPVEVQEDLYSPWPSERIIGLIFNMHWRFAVATGGQLFVTTDNPAFFFTCYGLGTQDSELTFPVSNELAIFGSWTPTRETNRIIRKTQFVKEANRRLISDATRFVYHWTNADWIVTVAAKDAPYLSRIRW